VALLVVSKGDVIEDEKRDILWWESEGEGERWNEKGLFNCVCERAIKRGKSGKRGRSPRKPPQKEIADNNKRPS
jgi:hypothetical protein